MIFDIQVIQFNTESHPLINGFILEVLDGIVPMAFDIKITSD
jgi:hypothetical protein